MSATDINPSLCEVEKLRKLGKTGNLARAEFELLDELLDPAAMRDSMLNPDAIEDEGNTSGPPHNQVCALGFSP
jgi:hypothetical protein